MKAELLKQLEPFVNDNWTAEHPPSFHPAAEYQRVEQQYLEQCIAFPGVRDVWKVGEVSVPGISDIDFVVGCTDPLPDVDPGILSIHHTDTPGPYILFHQPLFLSKGLLRDLLLWGSVSTLHCLYGNPEGIQPLTPDQSRIMALISLNDIFVQTQPRMLLNTLLRRHMHVRGTLCQINALKHTLRLFREATGWTTTAWDDFTEEFSKFRHHWFDLGAARMDHLQSFVAQSIGMLFEVMAAYHQALIEQGWIQTPRSKVTIHFLAGGFRTRFVSHWDGNAALAHTLSEWNRTSVVSLELPLACLEPLRSYANRRGPLSSHVKQYLWPVRLVPASLWQDHISTMAARHVQTRNAHVEFLLRNNLLWSDATFSPLGLWPSILTDHSLRGWLRRPYYSVRKWKEVIRLTLAG